MPPTYMAPVSATRSLSFVSNALNPRGIKASEVDTNLGSSNDQDYPQGWVFSDGHVLFNTPLFLLVGALGWVMLMVGLIYCCRRSPGSRSTQKLRSTAEKNTVLRGHHHNDMAYLGRGMTTDDDPTYYASAAAVFGPLAQPASQARLTTEAREKENLQLYPPPPDPPRSQEVLNPFSNKAAINPFIAGEQLTGLAAQADYAPNKNAGPLWSELETKSADRTVPLGVYKNITEHAPQRSNSALDYATRQAQKSGLSGPSYLTSVKADDSDPFQDGLTEAVYPKPEVYYPDQAPLPPSKEVTTEVAVLPYTSSARFPTTTEMEAEDERRHQETQEDAPLILNESSKKGGKYRHHPPSPQRKTSPVRTQGPRPKPAFVGPAQRISMQAYSAQRRASAEARPVRMKSTSTARGADLVRSRSGMSAMSNTSQRQSVHSRHRSQVSLGQVSTGSGSSRGPVPIGPRPRGGRVQGSETSPPTHTQGLPSLNKGLSIDADAANRISWWRKGYDQVAQDDDPTGFEGCSPISPPVTESIATDAATVRSTNPDAAGLVKLNNPPSAFPRGMAPAGPHARPKRFSGSHQQSFAAAADTRENPWQEQYLPEPAPRLSLQSFSPTSHLADVNALDPYEDTDPLYGDAVRSPSAKRREQLLRRREDAYNRAGDAGYDPYTNVAPLYPESGCRPASSVHVTIGDAGPATSTTNSGRLDFTGSSRKHVRRQSRPDGSGSAYGRRYRRTPGDSVSNWVIGQRAPRHARWPSNGDDEPQGA